MPIPLPAPGLLTVPAARHVEDERELPPLVRAVRVVDGAGSDVEIRHWTAGDGVHLFEATTRGAESLCMDLPCSAADHFAGGGAQFVDLDLRGRVIDGWLTDGASKQTYFHAPVLYSSTGWALAVDTVARYSFDVAATAPDRVRVTVPEPSLRAVLVLGSPRRCLAAITEMTGRAPLPPPWAFGVWHNVRSGPEAVLAQARRLREERIPASALWIDDHYCAETNDGDGWPGNYPFARYGEVDEMRALVEGVHALGFRALTYLNCMVYRDTPWFERAVREGLVVRSADGRPALINFFSPLHTHEGVVDFADGAAAILDFTNPDAIALWQSNVRRLLGDIGWDGWMEDFGEQVPPDAVMHDGSAGAAAHNEYALLYHGATAAVRESVKPDAVVFARSGYLGTQAMLPVYWGGDQLCEWSAEFGINSVIPGGLSCGLIGVGTWGCDISGLFAMPEKPLATGAADHELWMRWTQLGALTPVMRTHLGFKPEPTPPLDLWHDAEMTAHFRRCAELHVRLFPYLDMCARECSDTGMPIMRALLLEFPDDELCWTLSDQYMLGPSLLVAPVLERGARTRRVYLPAGGWQEVGTTRFFEGPAWVEVDAPLDRVPIFQRAGSIVPLLAETPLTLADERFARGEYDLELLVTTGAPASATLGDGTTMTLTGAMLVVDGPSRSCLVGADGLFMGLARGSRLDFELTPAVRARERAAAGAVIGPAEVAAARAGEKAAGVHHDEAITPEPPRPGLPSRVRARAAADLDVVAGNVRYTTDGSDPTAGGGAPALPMRFIDGAWEAELPALDDGTVLRYAIALTLRDGTVAWAEDAGPGLERPDPDVAFVRPAARVFRHVVHRPRVPQWFREATVYHLLVDRFARGDGSSVGRPEDTRFLQFSGGTLQGITRRLDHLSDLGIDCVLLSPITPGEMHVTYDVKDLQNVDPRFGTLDDVRTLLREAHARGIRVLLDWEASYLGVRHPAAADARTRAQSPHRRWFHWHRWPDRWYTWFSGRIFMGVDHTNPEVRHLLLDAARFWIDLGFDGFRLDSAGATPFEFWSEFGEVVRAANPDAVTLAEAVAPPDELRHYRGRLTGVLDFHLSHLLRDCFATQTAPLTELDALMRERSAESQHDGDELARAIFIENHDLPRFSRAAGDDDRRLLLALTALLTLGPTPILYYGTEVGLRQGRTLAIDPDSRLPMLWDADQHAALHDRVRRLVRLRRDTAALRHGEWRPVSASAGVIAYARGEDAVVAINRGATAARLHIGTHRLDVPARGSTIRTDGTAL